MLAAEPLAPIQGGIVAAVPAMGRCLQEPIDRFLAGEILFDDLQAMSVYDAYAVADAGHRLYTRGHHTDAQALFEGLAMANPYDAYFQAMLGACYQVRGDAESALMHYDRAVELNPDAVFYRANRGELRLRCGALEGAFEDLLIATMLPVRSADERQAQRRAQTILDGTRQAMAAVQAR